MWDEAGWARWRAELIEVKGDARDEILLRKCTYAGRSYGEESFVAALEEEFGRSWRRWGFENKETAKG